MRDIHQMLLTLTKVSWPSNREQSGYYSKSTPTTVLNSIRTINSPNHQQITVSTVPQSRKARGQVTVAWIVKVFTIHSNHDRLLPLSVETVFTPSKSRFSPWFQQFSAASDAPFSLFKGANSSVFSRLFFRLLATAEIPSLSSKGFHSRNTLEVQPSFRNSLLNTVYHCKPQSAILFYLPHNSGISEPSRLISSSL